MDIETFDGVNINSYFLNLWRIRLVYAVDATESLLGLVSLGAMIAIAPHDLRPATPLDRRVN